MRNNRSSSSLSSSSSSSSSSISSSISSKSSTIFPMHILGGGSIGLLYASGMHRAYNELRENCCNDDAHDDDSHGLLSSPVTLLLRSHHKPRLRRRRFDTNNNLDANKDKATPHWFATVEVSNNTAIGSDGKSVGRKCDIPVELIGEAKSVGDVVGTQQHHLSTGDDRDDHSPIKCLLLCTKANDAIPALNSVWDRLVLISSPSSSPSSLPTSNVIIILSNGALAIRDAIREHFDTGRNNIAGQKKKILDDRVHILLATTTHGAYRTQSTNDGDGDDDNVHGGYNVTHAGEGSTHCTNKEFIHTCQSIGWSSTALSELDMNVMLWKKLAVNCVINPLTAIHGVKNGQLLLDFEHMGQGIHTVTRQILEEVSHVAILDMESLFEETHEGGEHNKNLNDEWLRSTREQLAVPELEAFVFKVMADTAGNISSMLQDVKARRVTEVRYLNGYVSSLGEEKYGVQCPSNLEMCQLVEKLMP